MVRKDDLSDVLAAFNRVATLAKNAKSSEIMRDLFTEDEIILYDSYNNIEDKVLSLINKKEYDKALDLFATLREPIDNFF